MIRRLTIVIDYDDTHSVPLTPEVSRVFDVEAFMIDMEEEIGHMVKNIDYVDEEVKNSD